MSSLSAALILPITPPRPTKRARREITNEQRVTLRQHFFEAERKPTHEACITWFKQRFNHDLSQSQVSKILSDQYSSLDKKDSWQNYGKNRQAVYPDLEEALYQWQLTANRSTRITVTGDTLKEIASRLWDKLPQYSAIERPKFSNGWLAGFKIRHKIRKRKKHGESATVDKAQLELDLTDIRAICDLYEPFAIFNMDETALYWKQSPDSTLASEDIAGSKLDKHRITINFCCNSDGSIKLEPWFIGTAAKPRAFGNIEVHNLGLIWRNNKKAWMTGPIFREYLRWFDTKMRQRGLKSLLLIDGFSSHRSGFEILQGQGIVLTNVRLEFLPPNTTSVCQPLDQGIIKAFKAHYKRRWLRFQLATYEAGQNPFNNHTILQALRWSVEAWQEGVSDITIINCWLKSRVLAGQTRPMTRWQAQQGGWSEAAYKDAQIFDQLLSDARDALRALERYQFIKKSLPLSQILDPSSEQVDDNPDNTAFIDQIAQAYAIGPDIDPDEVTVEVPTAISAPQALAALATVQSFVEQQQGDNQDLIRHLNRLRRTAKTQEVASLKQSTLDSFLVPK